MKQRKIWIWLLPAVSLALGLVFFSRLPETIPFHWNLSGQADGFVPKYYIYFYPLVSWGLLLLLTFLPQIDPRRKNYQRFSRAYEIMEVILVLFFLLLTVYTILISLYDFQGDMVLLFLLGSLFLVFGNFMPKVQPNYFVGIKTPWTLHSEKVWDQTHKLGGKLWVLVGLLMILSALLPRSYRAAANIFCAVLLLWPIPYSYWAYQKEIKERKK